MARGRGRRKARTAFIACGIPWGQSKYRRVFAMLPGAHGTCVDANLTIGNANADAKIDAGDIR
jgi:hypothetical protein